ncbi:hypothetical protein [uncultured Sanguibacteroides sp.]|uniref:hypothetical protein n=1 Tax=uncultured Sanguibacteroides sp. TaxID=1635151 RepID=UPI0025D58A96|nr:hypothetical protein [uncultured Sanguibacteroides sp.]
MKVFYNNWLAKNILVSRCNRIMLLGFCFTKEDYLNTEEIYHERIHVRQWIECIILGIVVCLLLHVTDYFSWWFLFFVPILYYILYGIEFIMRLIISRDAKIAYENISFEKEAYRNENNLLYLNSRRFLAFLKYRGKV